MKILITAGPTREYIDPVRFLSNPSSGKMGYALAKAAKNRGHEVILISGPTHLVPPEDILVISVGNAREMAGKVMEKRKGCNCIIMAAAVSDFRPMEESSEKIKKSGRDSLTLTLVRNPDILYELGNDKQGAFLVGFAAETQNVITQAQKKMREKNVDLIVANKVDREILGFAQDSSSLSLLTPDGNVITSDIMNKTELAVEVIKKIEELANEST